MNSVLKAIHIFIVLFSLYVYHLVTSLTRSLIPGKFRKKKSISGQKVLITGAGRGIGRALAIEFSKHATSLILVGRNRKTLLETAELIDRRSSVFVFDCDVSDYKMVYDMAKKVLEEAGDVDILVNNAGIVSGHYLLDLPEEKIIKTLEVNTLGHFWVCKSFLPSMMAKNSGHIVTMCSIAGHTGGPKLTDYCSSKFAVIGFSESLEMEMKSKNIDGIKMTIVCPAHINTGLFDGMKITVSRTMTADQVAKETVEGILEEKETIFVPQYLTFLFMLKAIIPRWLNIAFFEMTDNLKMMDNFTGRLSAEETTNEVGSRN